MKEFRLVITADVKEDLRRYLSYIRNRFKNPQAIRNVRDDFIRQQLRCERWRKQFHRQTVIKCSKGV